MVPVHVVWCQEEVKENTELMFGHITVWHWKEKQMNKGQNKNKILPNKLTHATRNNLWIPMTPQYRYTVCCGVPKCTTIPISAIPVLEEPWVYPYLCKTLSTHTQGDGVCHRQWHHHRFQHGYRNTCGVSKTGHVGLGMVWEFGNHGYTVPVTMVSWCHMVTLR